LDGNALDAVYAYTPFALVELATAVNGPLITAELNPPGVEE
jgi:hypothetical protein